MGFFAVLAASLFAVFLFTVFGGYSLLLWCQQSPVDGCSSRAGAGCSGLDIFENGR